MIRRILAFRQKIDIIHVVVDEKECTFFQIEPKGTYKDLPTTVSRIQYVLFCSKRKMRLQVLGEVSSDRDVAILSSINDGRQVVLCVYYQNDLNIQWVRKNHRLKSLEDEKILRVIKDLFVEKKVPVFPQVPVLNEVSVA